MGRLRDSAGEFNSARALFRIVAGKRIRPEKKRAKPADLNSNIVRQLADVLKLFRSRLWREIALQVIIQLDALEACVLREPQTLFQGHPLRIRKGPQVDRLLHPVTFGRGAPGVWLR